MSGVKGKSGVYERTEYHKRINAKGHTKQLFCDIENCNEKHFGKGLCEKHYKIQYRIDHKEYSTKYKEQHRKDNKKEIKQYYLDNKESYARRHKQWCKDNAEHKAEYSKQYYKTPIGKAVAKAGKYKRKVLTSDLTKETVQRVYEDNIKKYGTLTCCLCFKPVEFKDSSLEHLTPITRGGSNLYENLGIAHLICNIRKQAMTLAEWFIKQGEIK